MKYITYRPEYDENTYDGMDYMSEENLWWEKIFVDYKQPGGGKSYGYFYGQKIQKRYEQNPNLKGVFYITPLREGLSDQDVQRGFYDLCQRINKVPIIYQTTSFSEKEFKRHLDFSPDSFVLVLMTLPSWTQELKKYNKKRTYDVVHETILNLGLKRMFTLVHSEGHRSPSKDHETNKKDTGLTPSPKAKYLRRKSYPKSLKVFDSVMIDTATPTQSMKESPELFYFPKRPKKSLGMFRVSPINKIYEFDYDKSKSMSSGYKTCRDTLQDMVLKTFEIDKKIKHLIETYKLHKLKNVVPKGMIKVNMVHKDYQRINRNNIQSMFLELDLPSSMSPFEVVVVSSDTDRFQTYRYEVQGSIDGSNKSVTFDRTDNDFESIQDVYDTLNDITNTQYRFLVVTEMGNQGINVPSIYTYLPFREPTGKYEGDPVIHNSYQGVTRPSRINYLIEDIQEHGHLTPEEVKYLWVELNEISLYLPKLSKSSKNPEFWNDVTKKLREDYYMSYEILNLDENTD